VKPGLIYALLPKVMGEIGAIEKTRQAKFGDKYWFRGIDDIYKAAQPALIKYGVTVAPSVLESKREERTSNSGGALTYTVLKMAFRFYAEDGSFVEVVTMGEAMDSSDKSTNKAQSAAMKYAFLQTFCIPTEEDNDTENSHPEPAPRQQGNGQQNGQRQQSQQRAPQGTSAPAQGNGQGNGQRTSAPAAKSPAGGDTLVANFVKDAQAAKTHDDWRRCFEGYLDLAKTDVEALAIGTAAELATDDPARKLVTDRVKQLRAAAAPKQANGTSEARPS
jgi:hypothetical protein